MLSRKEKNLEDERNFDSLPEGAKKRRALNLCKDADLRKGAGYSSNAICNEAVLRENYAITFPISNDIFIFRIELNEIKTYTTL